MDIDKRSKKKQQRINRYSTLAVLVVIVLLTGITYFIAQKSMLEFSRESFVDLNESVPVLQLHVIRQDDKTEFEPGKRGLSIGDTVHFEVSTQRPFHTALAVKAGSQPPVAVFIGAKIPPGPKRLFEKEDDVFVYEITEKPVRFCLLYESTAASLKAQLDRLSVDWPSYDGARCVTVD